MPPHLWCLFFWLKGVVRHFKRNSIMAKNYSSFGVNDHSWEKGKKISELLNLQIQIWKTKFTFSASLRFFFLFFFPEDDEAVLSLRMEESRTEVINFFLCSSMSSELESVSILSVFSALLFFFLLLWLVSSLETTDLFVPGWQSNSSDHSWSESSSTGVGLGAVLSKVVKVNLC